jgi:hypothetical protein
MKELTIITLSGKKIFIDNIGSCFMVNDDSFKEANFFSSLDDALTFARKLI